MILTKEHIGEKVRRVSSQTVVTVCGIDGDTAWIKFESGLHDEWSCNDNWMLIEEPKKPSEIILEKAKAMGHKGLSHAMDGTMFAAFFQYLDEQAEKK